MDGEPDDTPIDPKLEELLKQELAVPRVSEERTMDGLALRLKANAPRTRNVARPEAGWRRHFLAAAVMLALILGLFALLALSRGPGPVKPDDPKQNAVAVPNEKKNLKGDEQTPPTPKQGDPAEPLTAAQLATLVRDIEAGTITEPGVTAARLIRAGLAGKESLEAELKALAKSDDKKNERARIIDALTLFQKEQDKQFTELCAALDAAPKDQSLYLAPEPRLLERMQKKVTFDFVDSSIDESLSFIEKVSSVPIKVDPKVPGAMPNGPGVNLRVSDMTCDLALDWVLRLENLEAVKRGSVVIITTPERAARLTRQFRTFQLPVAAGDAAWTLEETKILCEVLAASHCKATAAGTISCAGNDAQLASLAQAIKNLTKAHPAPTPPEWVADMDKKLSKHVTFEFADQTFEDALIFLNSLTKVNIIADPRMAAKGTLKTPVTLKVADVPLGEALAQLCQLARVSAVYRNQAVFIAETPVALEMELYTFDLKPALQSGIPAAKLNDTLHAITAAASDNAPHAYALRSTYCGIMDIWTAGRIATFLAETAKSGKLAEPPPAPWFFKTLKSSIETDSTPEPKSSSPALSSARVYVNDQDSIWRSFDGSAKQIVAPQPGHNYWIPKLALGGALVVYIDEQDHNGYGVLKAVRADGLQSKANHGSGPKQLSTVKASIQALDVSPDGTQIAFASNDRANVLIASVELNKDVVERDITPDGSIQKIAWSPDGSTLAVLSSANQLFLLNAKGGKVTALPLSKLTSVGTYKWSPDSSRIAYMLEHFTKQLDVPSQYDLCVVDLNGKSTILEKDTANISPEWSLGRDGLYLDVGKRRYRMDP